MSDIIKKDEAIPRHIPDDWIGVWREIPLEELMKKAQRLEEHINTLQTEESKKPMIELYMALTAYIESNISSRDIDLDSFL